MPREKKNTNLQNFLIIPDFSNSGLSSNTLPGMSALDAEIENRLNPNANYVASVREDMAQLYSNLQPGEGILGISSQLPPSQDIRDTPLEINSQNDDTIEIESVRPRYWRDSFNNTTEPSNRPQTTVPTEEEAFDSDTLLNWYDEETDQYNVENWSEILKKKVDSTVKKFKIVRDTCRQDFLKDVAKKNKILPLGLGEELIYKCGHFSPTKLSGKIQILTDKVSKCSIKQLDNILELISRPIQPNDYMSVIDFRREKWFGFNVNADLLHLWELVEIPLNYCKIYCEEEVKKEDISSLLGYISEICIYTRSKQALFFVKYFAEGSRAPSGKNKRGFSEYKRTFEKVLDENDKRSYCSVSKMLSCVLNVSCAFKNKQNCHGIKGNLTAKESDINSDIGYLKEQPKLRSEDKEYLSKVAELEKKGIPWQTDSSVFF